jgi:hypothetical protein
MGSALAAETPREIDPNTKIQGGADVSGSGSSAGASEQRKNTDEEKPRAEKDKPISERKPQERGREETPSERALQRPSQPLNRGF